MRKGDFNLVICIVYLFFQFYFLVSGIAHHLAGLPGPPPEWALLGGRHPYPNAPFMGHHHPHFTHHMFAALDRPLNISPRIANGKKKYCIKMFI